MTPPFPAGLSPLRANLQALGLLAVVYGFIYGNAYLGSGAATGRSPLLGTFVTGSLMLLVVALFVLRDADWKASLGVQPAPLLPTLGFGLLGVVAGYLANIVLALPYALLRGGLAQQAADKAQWSSKLTDLPFLWVLPLAMFVGLWEEVVFRGFLLGRLRVALNAGEGAPTGRTVLAVLFSAVLFGAGHGYQGVLGLIQTTTLGCVFGALTVYRKSIWPAVIAHLTIDAFGLFALKVLKPALEQALQKMTTH